MKNSPGLNCSPAMAAQSDAPPSPVLIEPNVIREIGAVHPRFALALVSLNIGGGLVGDWAQVSLTPMQITSEDVEWWLKPEAESVAYFKKFDARGQKINLSGAKPVVYEVKLETPDTSSSLATLRIRVLKGYAFDFQNPSMEIRMEAAIVPDSSKRIWKVKGWQLY